MSQFQEIQFLINEIDKVLPKASADPLKLKPEDIAGQHRVLERVQSYLRSRLRQPSVDPEPSPLNPTEQEAAWRIAQAVITRLDRSTGYTSDNQEIEELEYRRDTLQREIRRLQSQYDQLVTEAVQTLTNRLQTNLQGQFQPLPPRRPDAETANVSVEAEYIEQLKQHSDQMLLNLDSTLQSVFNALEQDVQAYQQSLSAGLAQIHDLGQQSEAVVTGYLQRLQQQDHFPDDRFLATPTNPDLSPLEPDAPGFGVEANTRQQDHPPTDSKQLFPFAGAELSELEPTIGTNLEQPEADNPQIDALMNLDLTMDGIAEDLEQADELNNREENWYDPLVDPEVPQTETEVAATQTFPAEEQVSLAQDQTLPVELDLYGTISNPAQGEKTSIEPNAVTEATMPWSNVLSDNQVSDWETETQARGATAAHPPEAIDTIRQLTDLLVETHWYAPQGTVVEKTEELLSPPKQDEDFTPVAPEEDLLAQENIPPEVSNDLEGLLDQNILQQLSEDLERFESIQTQGPEIGENSAPVTESDPSFSDSNVNYYVTEESEPSEWEDSPDSEGFDIP